VTQETIKTYTKEQIIKTGSVEEEQMLKLGDLAPLMSIFLKTNQNDHENTETRLLAKYGIGVSEMEYMKGKRDEFAL